MGWDVVSGDARLTPSNGGNSNEVVIEVGTPKRVKLLFDELNKEPYSFFEHMIEVETMEDGKAVSTFRTVRCAKTKKNPNAYCPLCNGQQARRRVRHACNVWDYDSASVLKLRHGEQIFKPIGVLVKMGTDIQTVDFALNKTGSGRNNTEYSSVNVGPAQLQALPADTVLFNIEESYQPNTADEMKSVVEAIGGNWEVLTNPPAVKYPATLQEALDHEMPNTKYKGSKLGDIFKENKGMISFLANSDRISEEKGMCQAILVALDGASIPGVPDHFYTNGHAPAQPAQTPSEPTAPVGNTQQPAGNDRAGKIAKVNDLFQVKKHFVDGGYTAMIDMIKEVSNGRTTSINEFTDVELDTMITKCEALA